MVGKSLDEEWIVITADVFRRTDFPTMSQEDLETAARSVLAAMKTKKSGSSAVPGVLGERFEEAFKALAKAGMLDLTGKVNE